MERSATRRLAAVATTLLMAITAVGVLSAPAAAAPPDVCKEKTAACLATMRARVTPVVDCPDGNHCVYYAYIGSARHDYYNGDQNFNNEQFNQPGDGYGYWEWVDNNAAAAANSTQNNRESHYYYSANPTTSSRLVFCVNPQGVVWGLTFEGGKGDGRGTADEASALIIRPRTSVSCLA